MTIRQGVLKEFDLNQLTRMRNLSALLPG